MHGKALRPPGPRTDVEPHCCGKFADPHRSCSLFLPRVQGLLGRLRASCRNFEMCEVTAHQIPSDASTLGSSFLASPVARLKFSDVGATTSERLAIFPKPFSGKFQAALDPLRSEHKVNRTAELIGN